MSKSPPLTKQETTTPPDRNHSSNSLTHQSADTSALYEGVSGVAKPVPQNLPPSITAKSQANPWSSSLQSLLDQPPSTLPQRLTLGGIAFCIAFGAWAWFETIEEVGKAQGKLVPEGKTYKVEPNDIGRVVEVAVKEGKRVHTGTVIVKLDSELPQKEIERLEQMLDAYQTELGQKQALLEKVTLEARFRAAIAAAETTAQQSAITMTEEKVGISRQLLEQMRLEEVAYRVRQNQVNLLSKTAQEQREQLHLEAAAHQQRVERLEPLVQKGAISQEFIFEAEQESLNAQQRLTQNQLQEITDIQGQLFTAEQSLREIKSRMTQSQSDLSSSLKEAGQRQAQLTQKQAEERRLEIEAQQQIQQLKVDITQLNAKIAETQNLLMSAKTQFKQKFLKAPVDGTVLSLNLQNTGEVVQPGQTVAEIAPDGAPLILSTVLPSREAGFVRPGMPVKVKFDAYPYQDYGVVSGEVISISADAKPNEKLGAIYQVDVALERDYIETKQKKINLKAGQTATADIVIRRRRIVDILFDPFKQLQKGGIDL